MNHDALMMEFPDERAAKLAEDTFRELGYDPYSHGGGKVHIHVQNEDLTSALEIMQSCGGRIVEQARGEAEALTDCAYDLDAIPIPAHTVNEDWVDAYASGADTESLAGGALGYDPEEDAPYDRFEAT
ncbi:hypothetical protein [Cohnella caldifontis]|uniref:hypothetical protein n=1 Tax=Cohnella caldifontis TaxID=3027471 RepID=UPI0023EBFCB1|nr:hypothetical protein [Cohnella sp. YIM B05605]